MDINALVKITSRAWSLKILALLHEGVPGKQAALLTASKASRTAFGASLKHLVDLQLLERNPGHGHPLRPEFRLTPLGARAAKTASNIIAAVPQPAETKILRKSWTVPILAVTKRPRHFGELKSDLSSISDRALSQSLNLLEGQAWLRREVDISSRPLRPTYQATQIGINISQAANVSGL
ncbi:MAG: winged helix-turn-helix transcriptional regulator [Hellea sp.]